MLSSPFGLVSLTGLDREAWPTVPFYHVEVSMAYPGATPEEVEESIVVKIEDQVSGLDDVKAVKSVAGPGIASIRVQMNSGTDMDQALNDIESAVNRIQSFPVGAERPQFREMTNRQSMMRLIVYGDVSERALKELAYQVEDKLAALPSVSQVEVSGVRRYEISIEVPLHRLSALGLTPADIANTIRRSSLELSSGSIDTRESQVRVRTLGQNYDQQDFEEIVLLSGSDGTVVRLGDIARVRDDFAESDLIVRHQNHPAAFVEVYRADGEQVMDVATAVKEHLVNEVIPALPEGVGITIWNDESQDYAERVDILIKNGILGLLLVLIALSLFLEIRLAIWVAVGLAVSGIGGPGGHVDTRRGDQRPKPVLLCACHWYCRRRCHRRFRAHPIRTHAGYPCTSGCDPRRAADKSAVDLCGPHFSGCLRSPAVHSRWHRRVLAGPADHHDRHPAGFPRRITSDPAQPPVPFAWPGMGAEKRVRSVLRTGSGWGEHTA